MEGGVGPQAVMRGGGRAMHLSEKYTPNSKVVMVVTAVGDGGGGGGGGVTATMNGRLTFLQVSVHSGTAAGVRLSREKKKTAIGTQYSVAERSPRKSFESRTLESSLESSSTTAHTMEGSVHNDGSSYVLPLDEAAGLTSAGSAAWG